MFSANTADTVVLRVLTIGFFLIGMLTTPYFSCLHAQTQDADESLYRAIQAYEQGNDGAVVTFIQRAIESGNLEQWDLVDAYKVLGITHVRIGDEESAEAAFRKLLSYEENYTIAEPIVEPYGTMVLQLFQRIRNELSQESIDAQDMKGRRWWLWIASAIVAGGTAALITTLQGNGGSGAGNGGSVDPLVGPPPGPPVR